MRRYWNSLGFQKKVYIIFGVVIIAIVVGIAYGQFAFHYVQVGGSYYRGITAKRSLIDDIARIRMNVNMVKASLFETTLMQDHEGVDIISGLMNRTDELFQIINEYKNSDSGGENYCGLCHSLGQTNEVFDTLERAARAWENFHLTVKRDFLGAVQDGNFEEAQGLITGELSERYFEVMENTSQPLNLLRGIYPVMVDEIVKKSQNTRMAYLIAGVLGVLYFFGIAFFFVRAVVNPINQIALQSQRMAEGYFIIDSTTATGEDEIGMMKKHFNKMGKKVADFVSGIKSGITSLSSSAVELSATSDHLRERTKGELYEVNQVVGTSREMEETFSDVKENATAASQATRIASEAALRCKALADKATAQIMRISEIVHDTAETMEKLGRSSGEIEGIVSVINDIADQTNLLALNAAIEAARAGEHGRGFAVVADEVKKLAEKTGAATEEITTRIKTIQEEAERSLKASGMSRQEVEQGVEVITSVKDALDSILDVSEDANKKVEEITSATEAHTEAIQKISERLHHLAEGIREVSTATEQISQVANSLSSMADELKERVEWFKTGDDKGGMTQNIQQGMTGRYKEEEMRVG